MVAHLLRAIDENTVVELYDVDKSDINGQCLLLESFDNKNQIHDGWQELDIDKVRFVSDRLVQATIYVRRCSECGDIMFDGYVVDDGMEYYCSDECLHKHFTDKEWQQAYDEDWGYWTHWY